MFNAVTRKVTRGRQHLLLEVDLPTKQSRLPFGFASARVSFLSYILYGRQAADSAKLQWHYVTSNLREGIKYLQGGKG